ncbi:hypothetical protein N9B80_02310, partial [Methylophilaceae bacterium]|nr:hypothetical protein [Methylophilaceae bacterium]
MDKNLANHHFVVFLLFFTFYINFYKDFGFIIPAIISIYFYSRNFFKVQNYKTHIFTFLFISSASLSIIFLPYADNNNDISILLLFCYFSFIIGSIKLNGIKNRIFFPIVLNYVKVNTLILFLILLLSNIDSVSIYLSSIGIHPKNFISFISFVH